MNLPPLEVREHDGIRVVRDDLIDGGTKVRVVPALLEGFDEVVYAGPAQGHAQVALARACELTGKRGVLFTPARKEPHELTLEAMAHGLHVVFVPAGRLSVLNARARDYCALTGAFHAPLGLLLPGMGEALTELARSLPETPTEVWVTAGSGTLASALARAWPDAELNAVQVGKVPALPPHARLWQAPEAFHDPATGQLPPFPSALCYDAKAWRFVAEHASPGALFWNVAR